MTRQLIIEADGGSRGNPGPAGYGALVRDARTGEVLAEMAESVGRATNNVAEYSGLVAACGRPPTWPLALTSRSGWTPGWWSSRCPGAGRSSILICGRWPPPPGTRPAGLGRVSYHWVPRARNTHADRLANQAIDEALGKRPGGRERPGGGRPEGNGRSGDSGSPPGGADPAGAPPPGPGWAAARGQPATTVLLRHGQTPLSAERRFACRGDIPLTETGMRQAEAAARRLAARGGIDAIVTSPLQRARRTADAVASATGAPVRVDDAWMEMDFGEWEGLSYTEAADGWPDEMAAWMKDSVAAPPGGESIAAAARRVLPALDRVRDQPPGTVVVVSHVTPMKIVLRHALLAPPPAVRRMHLDVACLCEIDWYDEGLGVVRTFNDTAHLMPASKWVSS